MKIKEKEKRDRKCNRWRVGQKTDHDTCWWFWLKMESWEEVHLGSGSANWSGVHVIYIAINCFYNWSDFQIHPGLRKIGQVMVIKSIHPVRHLLAVLYQPHPRHCDRHYWMHLPCNAVISPLTAILAGSQCCYLTWEVSLCKSPLHGSSGGEYLREGLARKIQNIFGRFHKKVEEEIQITFRKKSKKIWKKSERNQKGMWTNSGRNARDPLDPREGNITWGEVGTLQGGRITRTKKRKRIEVGQTAQKQVLVSRTQTLINVPFNDMLVDGLGWFSWVVI